MTTHTRLRDRHLWLWLAAGLLLGLVFVLIWGLNMRRGLNHDEHQFVASGALIARAGLLPYRDFPYFHVPLLSFLYAGLFETTGYLLLAARTLSILCSWLTLLLIFAAGVRWLQNLTLPWRVATAAATILLLMATPSFLHASGRAWNHDLPILLTLTAAAGQAGWLARAGRQQPDLMGARSRPQAPEAGVRRQGGLGRAWWPLLAGLLLGLAAATRATFVFTGVAFVLSFFLISSWRTRLVWAPVALFVLGALLGALPALYLLARAPAEFIFGNLTYAGLNTAYYQVLAGAEPGGVLAGAAMTPGAKLLRTAVLIGTQPGNLLLMLLALVALWRARAALRRAPDLIFLLLLIPCFLLGAYAPTPLQEQYLYLLFPLLALIFLRALAYDPRPRLSSLLVAGAALLAALLAAPRYAEGIEVAFAPAEWFPLKVHARGEYVAQLVGGQPVLTLAPIYPLEGEAPIYPEFVTGPLGWRVAPLLSPAERQALGIVGLGELAADLAARPPRGILTGLDNSDAAEEAPLLEYAQTGGYVPIPLPDEGTLWAAPLAVWGDHIRLGAVDLPRTAVAAGDELLGTLHLQAVQPLDANLNVLVRLVAPGGDELARSEGWPWGRATTNWPPGEVWPDGHTFVLPLDAAPGPYRLEVSFYDPATLEELGGPATAGHIVVASSAVAADGETPPETPAGFMAQFGDGIMLLGADVPAAGWTADGTVEVGLTWQAETRPSGRYTVFLHLIGPGGVPVAQGDQEPWRGAYPTNAWLPGVPATDRYTLALPRDLPAGAYQLVAGLYDPFTQVRLPVLHDGKPGGADSVPLTTVEVR